MPFALIIFGLVLTIAGARGTQGSLFTLLKGDFTGDKSFIWWAASIIGVGAVGYIPDLKKLSNAFLALILVVLILHNSGVFSKFTAALKSAGNAGSSNDNSQVASNQQVGGTDYLAAGEALLESFG